MAIAQGSTILASDVSTMCRIATGSYYGVVDVNNVPTTSTTFQTTITFPFAPQIVFIKSSIPSNGAEQARITIFAGQTGGNTDDNRNSTFSTTWTNNGKSVIFTATGSVYNTSPFNSSPVGYSRDLFTWVALG